jgi:LysM repeat protein
MTGFNPQPHPSRNSAPPLLANKRTLLTLTPFSPNKVYHPVTMGIAGQIPLTQVSGSGGWQIVDRPRRAAATQWYDRSPFQLVIPAIMDQSVTRSATTPDEDVNQLLSWLSAPDVNATIIQPPTIKVHGPVLGTELTWVLYSLEHGDALRDSQSGQIIQQILTITLYEYNPPFPSLATGSGPAATAAKSNTGGSTKNYVVKAGDTLAKIASQQLKGVSLSKAESAIIDANRGDPSLNMRSPGQILTTLLGKTIKIPSS